jgi:glycosyltransferase involved in cell wall biosynthesis
MAKLVSVVMSAYNADKWIESALESVLAQTYAPLEIIIVNDGSTDQTAAILGSYQESHGIRVITQVNQGQSAALNNGFAISKGCYVKFFDSDDIMSPETIECQVSALEMNPGKLAYGTWGRFRNDPSEAVFAPHPGWHDSAPIDWIVETWTDTEPMYQCGLFLIPRELVDRAGAWDSRLGLVNDFEFFTRLILNSKGLVFTPDARLYYRSFLAASLSGQRSAKAIASGVLSCQLAVQYLIAAENSVRTRRVAADILMSFVFSFYPAYPERAAQLIAQADKLGGSSLLPGGDRIFRMVSIVLGWRVALRLRRYFAVKVQTPGA